MTYKARTLLRLANLYSTVEALRCRERDRAALAVFEAERAVGEQTTAGLQALRASRHALVSSSRQNALLHEAEREVARFNTERHYVQQKEYERLQMIAAQQHREAMQREEQMNTLVAAIRRKSIAECGRKEQAQSDDRFSSRTQWLRLRAKRHLNNS